MTQFWSSFLSDESGQGFTEYALILALVAVGLILVLTTFRDTIRDTFDAINTELDNSVVNQAQPGGGT